MEKRNRRWTVNDRQTNWELSEGELLTRATKVSHIFQGNVQKNFGHCALAQRSEASKRCSESQKGSEIMIFMIFMIWKILGFLMAELCLGIFHIHNTSMTMRLSGNRVDTYPISGL